MKKYGFLLLVLLIFGCSEQRQLGLRIPATAEQAKALQLETAKQLCIPVEKSVEIADNVNMDFVLIPAGQFHMGSPKEEQKRESDEGPLHQVRITKPFYMGKYEVTQQQYQAVCGLNKKFKFKGKQLPAENVDWNQANVFCHSVSNKTALNIKLPTEAQWEYSCRGGTNTPFCTGETINPDQANYDCKYEYNGSKTAPPLNRTKKIGSYEPNPFGLCDMHGNVWEWCQDIYKNDYYKKSPEINPVNNGSKGSRVIRGGSWNHNPAKLRCADRNKRIQGADRRHIGFRVVLEIDEQTLNKMQNN